MQEFPNLILTGFMGTGKSTVGKIVSEILQRPFIDMDNEIEKNYHSTIAEIFRINGEIVFRQYEHQLCQKLRSTKNFVIATGGGTLLFEKNRECFAFPNVIICLFACLDDIAQRLSSSSSTRPLFQSDWQKLFWQREKIYQSFTYQVDTSNKKKEEIAQQIISLYQKAIFSF